MLRPLFSLTSPGGPRGRLSILIFHRVVAEPDPLFPGEVDARRFDELCSWLARWFRVLPLDAAARELAEGRLPRRALAITFDDGYADNHDVALPILKKHGLCATFFVATGFLDGGRMWNDGVIEAVRRSSRSRLDLGGLGIDGPAEFTLADAASRRAAIDAILGAIKYRPMAERTALVAAIAERSGAQLPDDLMMSSAQVRALHRAGMQIGAHTVSHPILATLPRPEAQREIDESRRALEAIVGERIGLFAYPNGVPGRDFNDETVRIVAELGFDCAVTTGRGASHVSTDRLRLPRFTPWDRSRWRFGARLAHNLVTT